MSRYESDPTFKALVDAIPKQPPRQDSTRDQLLDLIIIARRFGLYDAEDWIMARTWRIDRPAWA